MNTTTNPIFNTERPIFQGQTIPLSMFHDIKDSGQNGFFAEQNHCISYAEFGSMLEWFAAQPFEKKKDAPLMSATIFSVKRALGTDGRWCVGYRCKANATICRLLMLDSDDAALSFEGACEILRGYECFIYTTGSHRTESPRVRLVVPMADMVGYETHKAAVTGLFRFVKERLGVPEWICDTGKLNAYSLFYVPGQYASADENKFVYLPGDIHPAEYWIAQYPLPIPPPQPHIEAMDYTLSPDADWSLAKCNPQMLSYLQLRDGRHNALFGVGVSIMMSAINDLYQLKAEDLANIILELQRRNPASTNCYIFSELMRSTIPAIVKLARTNVPVPVAIKKQQAIDSRIEEMRQYFEDEEKEAA